MTNRIDRIEAKEPAGAVAAHEAKAAAHTKAQVGLGNVQDYGVASTAEAQAGTAANKYMTPALTKAAITEQAGAAVSSHTGNKNNPHAVTKAQVGLGSVQDYGIATTAEAQAGTVANKYMTPATTAAAITQQAGAAVSSHTGNKSNPHGVTKAQVGLGSVNDWGATGATNDASDAKYATAGAVKKAYDLAASKAPASHDHTSIKTTDERSIQPSAVPQRSLTPYFRSATVGSGYMDFIALNSYSDNTGGKINAIAASKDDGRLYHHTAAVGASGWGTAYAIYSELNKPTPAAIGAAAASHNHAWGNITGVPVYATRWPTAAEAGAAPASHSHSYLPLSGGTLSNSVRINHGNTCMWELHIPSKWAAATVLNGSNGNFEFWATNGNGGWAKTYAYFSQSSGEFFGNYNGNFNDVYIRSDRRLKTNLVKAENALSKVSKINAYHYDKRLSLEATEYTEKEFGLIAQELEAVLPEAVKTDEQTTLKTISNSAVNALLVEAIKELKSEVEALKAKLSQAGA